MSFNPENHGFKKIGFIPAPGAVAHYEWLSNEVEKLEYDLLRLNVYLSQDGNFVNVWFGFLDALIAECQLGFVDDQRFNFNEMYTEPLFRGYIEDDETGQIILAALHIDKFLPQTLRLDDDGKLECYRLSAV